MAQPAAAEAVTRFAALAALVALAGCANPPPISNQPGNAILQAAEKTPAGQVALKDQLDASFNFEQAIAIGRLSPDDLVANCNFEVTTKLGYDPKTGQPLAPSGTIQEFTPRIDGVVSFGSVAYIDALPLLAAGGPSLDLTPNCYAVIGWLHWQTLLAAAKGVAGSFLHIPSLPGIAAGLEGQIGRLPKGAP